MPVTSIQGLPAGYARQEPMHEAALLQLDHVSSKLRGMLRPEASSTAKGSSREVEKRLAAAAVAFGSL